MDKNEKLFELLRVGTSPFHTITYIKEDLKKEGFLELKFADTWDLISGGKYFLEHQGTTLFAFTIPENENTGMLRMAAAHTDFPCFRIKPNPDTLAASYNQLNAEVYGGPIISTWLDRPLGVAGRIALKSDSVFEPKTVLFDSDRPIVTIPNIAIHMNPDINKGVEYNKQIELAPIFSVSNEDEKINKEAFLTYLAQELDVDKNDILDYELNLYCREQPEYIGWKKDFISSPRIDDISSVAALTEAIVQKNRADGVNLIALFDHEEIGSHTKQGAESLMLSYVLEKLLMATGKDKEQIHSVIYDSMLLSVDVAHAIHPNYQQKADPTNRPIINKGFCFKEASSQSYATDAKVVAIGEQICQKANIPYQKYTNRSDIRGGRTLGSLLSGVMPIRTLEIGIPILAMHSARECMGSQDYEALCEMTKAFFTY